MTAIPAQDLSIRPFEDGDAEAFAQAANESLGSVGRWMSWCHAGYQAAEALAWFDACRRERAAGTAHEFGLFDADTGALLGGAGLNAIQPDNRLCNLGYWVRQSAQRRGVAVRAVQALSAHAFGALGLQRVEVVVAVGNHASEGVARRAGAQWECVARNRLQLHGAAVPASVFSLVP